MGKLDALRAAVGANADESMGARRAIPAADVSRGSAPGRRARDVSICRDAQEIPVDSIVADPDQPRKEFDPMALVDLAGSIGRDGLLQPIRVRWDDAMDTYVIISGERRWRAAAMVGMRRIRCQVVEPGASPGAILKEQLVENCVRDDLKPIEQANAFRRLMDQTGWSQRQLAAELGIAPSTVNKALDLLVLPREAQDRIEAGTLSPSTAREIARVADPEARRELTEKAAAGAVTRDDVVRIRRPRPPRRTIALDGNRITVEGPAAADPALLEELFRRAARKVKSDAAA